MKNYPHYLYLRIGQVPLVSPIPAQQPYPNWYKLELTCEYHAGIVGHNIDSCNQFKNKLLQLIKVGWITFDEAPNMNTNPLPWKILWMRSMK